MEKEQQDLRREKQVTYAHWMYRAQREIEDGYLANGEEILRNTKDHPNRGFE